MSFLSPVKQFALDIIQRFTGSRQAKRLFHPRLEGKKYPLPKLIELAMRSLTDEDLAKLIYTDEFIFAEIYDRLARPMFDCTLEWTVGCTPENVTVKTKWTYDPRAIEDTCEARRLSETILRWYWDMGPYWRKESAMTIHFVDTLADNRRTFKRVFFIDGCDTGTPAKVIGTLTYDWDEDPTLVWPVGGWLTVVTREPGMHTAAGKVINSYRMYAWNSSYVS